MFAWSPALILQCTFSRQSQYMRQEAGKQSASHTWAGIASLDLVHARAQPPSLPSVFPLRLGACSAAVGLCLCLIAWLRRTKLSSCPLSICFSPRLSVHPAALRFVASALGCRALGARSRGRCWYQSGAYLRTDQCSGLGHDELDCMCTSVFCPPSLPLPCLCLPLPCVGLCLCFTDWLRRSGSPTVTIQHHWSTAILGSACCFALHDLYGTCTVLAYGL